jgi:hypothetical protein
MSTENFKNESGEMVDPVKKYFDYTQYVESQNFAQYKKAALDISLLLDSEDLRVKGQGYDAQKMSTVRKEAFDAFCFLCEKAGVKLPELEEELYLPLVPSGSDPEQIARQKNRVSEINNFVTTQIENIADEDKKRTIQVIAEFMNIFAVKFSENESYSGGLQSKEILALLNKELVTAGLLPVRPKYGEAKIITAIEEETSRENVRLLIVDDEMEQVTKTLVRLAGWPNISIDYIQYKKSGRFQKREAAELDLIMKTTVEEILSKNPSHILMDQGLDSDIEGSDLIRALKTDPRSAKIKFIANTGGSDDAMRELGAYENFNKGRDLRGLRRAILN